MTRCCQEPCQRMVHRGEVPHWHSRELPLGGQCGGLPTCYRRVFDGEARGPSVVRGPLRSADGGADGRGVRSAVARAQNLRNPGGELAELGLPAVRREGDGDGVRYRPGCEKQGNDQGLKANHVYAVREARGCRVG